MPHPSETRDGMCIDWNVPITMDDGLVLRADVFHPISDAKFPVILSYGPYAKGLAFQDGYPNQWQFMTAEHPDVAAGSSNKYQNWEVVDPEKWVPDGYVCVRVDSRGCGCSPGYIDHFSPRETRDFYNCIEWAGIQPWSNGKVDRCRSKSRLDSRRRRADRVRRNWRRHHIFFTTIGARDRNHGTFDGQTLCLIFNDRRGHLPRAAHLLSRRE
jgi:X-Pro dipeptidyl-peptidase-like protein